MAPSNRVISLLWANVGTKRYSHAIYDDYFTVYCRLLDNVFGRCEFKPMNKRLDLFEVIESWSIEHGTTKAYRPSDEAYKILNSYLQSEVRQEFLIDDIGGNMRRGANTLTGCQRECRQKERQAVYGCTNQCPGAYRRCGGAAAH